MKIAALDLGNVWTGTALSDPLRIIARPHKTVETTQLVSFLRELFSQESIERVIVGHPKTMKGTASEQTKIVETMKENLEQEFPNIMWILWDERLSSKHASQLGKTKTKADKLHQHSQAAAFILQSYLQFLG